MENFITLRQALLCGLLYWAAEANLPFVTLWTLQKPLVCGLVTGLILGNPVPGTLCGAVLSIVYLGFASAGSSMPADLALAGITGAFLCAGAGWDAYAAILPALLAGYAGRNLWKLRMRVNVRFARRVRQMLEAGHQAAILLPAALTPALFALLVCVPVCVGWLLLCRKLSAFILLIPCNTRLYGAVTVSEPVDAVAVSWSNAAAAVSGPIAAATVSWSNAYAAANGSDTAAAALGIRGILSAAGALMPAWGIARAAQWVRKGTDFPTADDDRIPADPDAEDFPDPDAEYFPSSQTENFTDPDAENNQTRIAGLSDKRTAKNYPFRRGLPAPALLGANLLWILLIHICYNNEWMMGQAMAVSFLPLVRRLCPENPEGQKQILLRQGLYFNTHCECGACIVGSMAAMEEELAWENRYGNQAAKRAVGEQAAKGGFASAKEPADKAEYDSPAAAGNPAGQDRSAPAPQTLQVQELLMVRSSLMGVCGAAGDKLFQKLLIPVLLSISCMITMIPGLTMAGPVFYTAVMAALSFAIGIAGFFTGYRSSPEQLLDMLESKKLEKAQASLGRVLRGLLPVTAILFVRFPVELPLPGNRPADLALFLIAKAAAAFFSTSACLHVLSRTRRDVRLAPLLLMGSSTAIFLVWSILGSLFCP